MRLAKVVGQVVATAKVPALSGLTILVVEDLAPESGSEGIEKTYAAIDLVGAGEGEVVLVTTGSAARVGGEIADTPTDRAVVAIADTVVRNGKVTYSSDTSFAL